MNDQPPSQTHDHKRHVPAWVVLLIVATMIGAAAGGLFLASQPKNGVRLEQLEADIHEQLPLGSSREEVLAWFTAHGITELFDLFDTGGSKAGYRAIVPNDTWLDKGTIEIMCRLDRQGKLTDVTIFRSREE
jgi:hypothetical protein